MNKKDVLKQIAIAENALREVRELLENKTADSVSRKQEEIDAWVGEHRCLRCGKKLTKKHTRGVHEKCYQTLRRNNALEQAQKLGHILPPAKPGPKAKPAILIDAKDLARQKEQ